MTTGTTRRRSAGPLESNSNGPSTSTSSNNTGVHTTHTGVSPMLSKASAILNAHKPMPLSQLLLGTSTDNHNDNNNNNNNNNNNKQEVETKFKRKRQLIRSMLFFGTVLLIGLILLMIRFYRIYYYYYSSIPSTKLWMDDPLILSLLAKTPKTKDNRYTVFITYSNGIDTVVTYGQCEKSAHHAMERAYNKIPIPAIIQSNNNINNNLNNKDAQNKFYIKVDAVMRIESVDQFHYFETTIPSLSGFAMGDWTSSSLVFLYEQVMGSALVDESGYLRWDHIGRVWANTQQQQQQPQPHSAVPPHTTTTTTTNNRLGGGSTKWPDGFNYDDATIPIDFIRTQAVFFDGKSTYNLVKGKRVLTLHDLTPQYLQESAQLAGDYLTRQVHEDGTMVYIYRPRSDAVPTDEGYSLTRHAGTAYSMALLYKTYKNPDLLKATQASLDYLVDTQMADCPLAYEEDKTARCIINEIYHGHKWTQLGVNALALLAMAEYMEATKDTVRYWEASQNLARWIEGTQHDDGSFVQDQDIETNRLDEDAYVRYFPGEAAFALARLYNTASAKKLSPCPDSWKTTAAKAMDYIVTRESNVEDEKFSNDHWMMYALAEMSDWHWTTEMLDFAVRTGKLAQERQIRHHADDMDQDRNGVYIRPGHSKEDTQSLNSCASATKSEGLCAVYPILQQKASPEAAKVLLDAAKWGIRYQLGTQMRPEQAMYMKKPWRSLGSMSKNILDTETRNDYAQHNLSSFLCLARVLQADMDDGGGGGGLRDGAAAVQ